MQLETLGCLGILPVNPFSSGLLWPYVGTWRGLQLRTESSREQSAQPLTAEQVEQNEAIIAVARDQESPTFCKE